MYSVGKTRGSVNYLGVLVKNHLYLCGPISGLFFIDLLMSTPYCLDYCTFIVSLELRQ